MRKIIIFLCAVFCLANYGMTASQAAESAAAYPSKPIRLIVPYPPGSGTDILARVLAKEMTKDWGQPVVVENKPGASTIIGTSIVAEAPPDGYTVIIASNNHAINPALFKTLPFDPIKDFTAVGKVAVLPFLLVVKPSTPIKTVKDLVDLARAKPGQLNYASTGNGAPPHVAAELLKQMAKIDLVHIPYKGSAAALTGLLSGSVDLMFCNSLSVMPHIKSGQLRAVAVGSPQRISILPKVPTVAESGYPGFEVSLWAGILARAGTPKPIIDKLNTELVHILGKPEVKKAFVRIGADVAPSTPEQFNKFIASEVVRLGVIAKRAHMHVD